MVFEAESMQLSEEQDAAKIQLSDKNVIQNYGRPYRYKNKEEGGGFVFDGLGYSSKGQPVTGDELAKTNWWEQY